MSSSRPPVEQISSTSEIEPSEGREEGTKDLLNEAPLVCSMCGDVLGAIVVWTGTRAYCSGRCEADHAQIIRQRDGRPPRGE